MTEENVVELPKSKVRFMRMSTGEDIVTEYSVVSGQDSSTYYIFYNPMKVLYIVQDNGKLALSMGSWIFPKICEEQEFVVYPEDVVTMGIPNQNILDCYHKTLQIEQQEEELSYMSDADQVMMMGDRSDLDMSDEDIEKMSELFSQYKKKLLH